MDDIYENLKNGTNEHNNKKQKYKSGGRKLEKEKKYELTPIDKNEYKLNDYNKHEVEIGRPEKLMYIMKDKLNSISEEKNTCYECKHFTPIISQGGAYKCLKKDRYFDYEYYKDCKLFEQDIKTLREKEERIWW